MPITYKRNCNYCKKYYEGRGKFFCSKKCKANYNPYWFGKHFTEKHKKRLGKAQIGNKKCLGKHWKVKDTSKMKEANKKRAGDKNNFWKDGRCNKDGYLSWLKNKRNRMPKIGSHTWGEWESLKKQYGFRCPSCGKCEPEIKLTQDHIIPLNKGGSDYIENIQPLCKSCNCKKHTQIIKYNLC